MVNDSTGAGLPSPPGTGPGVASQSSARAEKIKPERLWTSSFIFICLANLAVLANVHLIMPTLPLYVSHIGGDEKAVGLVIATFTITAMLMRPIGGMLLDRFGRKTLLFVGMITSVLITAGYNLASTIFLLLLCRLLHGASFSVSNTATGTIATDILPWQRLGQGMGYFGLTSSISMAVAPAGALWLVGQAGFTTLFFLSALVVLAGFFMSLAATSGLKTDFLAGPEQGRRRIGWSDFIEIKAVPASVVMAFLTMVFGAVVSLLVLFATASGISGVGLFFTANALAMMVARLLADRGGDRFALVAGMTLLAASMVIISFSSSIVHLVLAGIAYGSGLGFSIPLFQTLAVRDASPHRRGTAMGTFYSAFDLGIGLGAIIWGWTAATIGYRGTFLLNLLPVALASLSYYLFYIRKGRHSSGR